MTDLAALARFLCLQAGRNWLNDGEYQNATHGRDCPSCASIEAALRDQWREAAKMARGQTAMLNNLRGGNVERIEAGEVMGSMIAAALEERAEDLGRATSSSSSRTATGRSRRCGT